MQKAEDVKPERIRKKLPVQDAASQADSRLAPKERADEILREQAVRQEMLEQREKPEVEPVRASKRRRKTVTRQDVENVKPSPVIAKTKPQKPPKKPTVDTVATRPKAPEVTPNPSKAEKLPLDKPVNIRQSTVKIRRKPENYTKKPEAKVVLPPTTTFPEASAVAEAEYAEEALTMPANETINQAIQEILEFEPGATFEELIAGLETDESPAFLLAERRPEQMEQEGEESKSVFIELQEYVGTLEVTEPEKANTVRPMVDEVIQIAGRLVELQGLRAVDLGIKTDTEIAEADAQIAQIEARLEVVCRQLLEALEIEPTEENVQAFVQELMAAAQSQVHRKLSIEELANNYMHEAKLPSWFQQFMDDSLNHVQMIGILAMHLVTSQAHVKLAKTSSVA